MKLTRVFLPLALVALIPTVLSAQANFNTSLHGTRQGKLTFYSKDNGGFETLTDIPMDSLPCTHCHASTYADGSPVDPATYEPGCNDCHNFAQGSSVGDSTCLNCHGRQKAEIGMGITDVHRDMGMNCTSCHTKREMHGDGTTYASMLQPGAMDVSCENEGCHPPDTLPQNTAHTIHTEHVYCNACHAQTISSCYNCHFATEVEAHQKRFYGPPPFTGFTLLVNSERSGKVTTASFQSLVYEGKTFYTIAPFNGHTISKEARACSDCHANEIIQNYNQTGKITVAKWDSANNKIVNTQGVIPVPPDWQQALQFDFVDYTGDVQDPTKPLDPTKWVFLKSGADLNQMMYATPLTSEQLQKLSVAVSVNGEDTPSPASFALFQNYPNPFNPTTTIEFHLAKTSNVTLKVYDIHGSEVKTLFAGEKMRPGIHKVAFDAEDLASGIYVCRLKTSNFEKSVKMTLLR